MTSVVVPVILGLVVLLALAVVVKAIRERPKPLPKLDVSQSAYEKALRKWQRDYAKGTDKRPDFPHYVDWEAEQTLNYKQQHGVWPGEQD